MTISDIKFIIFTFVVPTYLIHRFLVHYYELPLGKLFSSIFKNFGVLEISPVLIIMSVIFLPLFLLPFGGFLNSVYLQVFGYKQELLYVGGDTTQSYYVDLSSPERPVVSDLAHERASSFSYVYVKYPFVRDRLDAKYAGERNATMTFYGMLGKFVFAISGFLIVLTAMCAYAAPVYQLYHPELQAASMLGAPFDYFLSNIRLSWEQYWILLLLSLPVSIVLLATTGGSAGSPHSSLPHFVKSGKIIQAYPQDISTVYIEERVKKFDRYEWVEVATTERDVALRFEEGFPYPIFLITRFDTEEFPEFESLIHNAIQNKELIPLLIQEDLTVQIQITDN